jgi:hypothetical protein
MKTFDKQCIMRMSQIVNDDKVSQSNSAQQAEYFHATDNSSKTCSSDR